MSELFQEQSSGWRLIATKHIEAILDLVIEWTALVIDRLVHEDQLFEEISQIYDEWVDNARKSAFAELGKLVDDERRAPLTYNHYYTDNIQKSRLGGQQAALKRAVEQFAEQDRNGKMHISNIASEIEGFVSSIGTRILVDMDEQACYDAMTQLDAYYKVCLKKSYIIDSFRLINAGGTEDLCRQCDETSY